MELYLVRHANAVKREAWVPRRDRSRPLTKSGARKMRRIARGMRALGIRADLILSSPFLRARETAEIIAAELEIPALELTRHLEPAADVNRLCTFLGKRAESAESVVLVGHEPALSSFVSLLLGGERAAAVKKGGLCKLRIDRLRCGPCAVLEWLVPPRALVRTE